MVTDPNGVTYDGLLNQTNINANNNKYYVLQVLFDRAKAIYYFWSRWGRVGQPGRTQHKAFDDLASAIALFEKKFTDKTKNTWAERADFKPVKGKYVLIERFSAEDDAVHGGDQLASEERKADSTVESKLDEPTQDLVRLIFDVAAMQKRVSSLGFDAEKLPLGKLSQTHIKKGYAILKKIEKILLSPDEADSNTTRELYMDLSSEFYTLIPHSFGMTRPPVISSKEMLKEKMSMIEELSELEIATKLIQEEARSFGSGQHPLDGQYESLQCGISPVSHDSEDFDFIERLVRRGHAPTHNWYTLGVADVFEVEKYDEKDKFAPYRDDPNRMLLWHGSRLTNYVGILSQGLRIAPPEAPITGYMFGKGVYFADMVTKSANYCFATPQDPYGILLLCEVALGEPNELFAADYHAKELAKKAGKQSTKGMGCTHPNPDETVLLPDGVQVPLGRPIAQSLPEDSSLLYNEYIVYNTAQVRIRYIVKVKFDFNQGDSMADLRTAELEYSLANAAATDGDGKKKPRGRPRGRPKKKVDPDKESVTATKPKRRGRPPKKKVEEKEKEEAVEDDGAYATITPIGTVRV